MNIKTYDDINLKVTFDTSEKGITKVEFYNKDNKKIYSYLGNAYITRLDQNNFMIQKKSKLIGNKEKECNDVTFLYIKDNKNQIKAAQSVGIQINPYDITDDGELLSSNGNLLLVDSEGNLSLPDSVNKVGYGAFSNVEGLKTIIIPGKYYYYLYSYDLGMIISSSYDYIKYDEEKDIFHVENYINTKYGDITLFGTLTRDGFLIDETLYAPEINKAYCVDSFNLRKYYEQIKKDVEKRLKRKERLKLYKACEEELTLKRKLH